jgi:hypothetical protein
MTSTSPEGSSTRSLTKDAAAPWAATCSAYVCQLVVHSFRTLVGTSFAHQLYPREIDLDDEIN